MRCTLTHRGVPLLAVDFEPGETMLEVAPAALLIGYRDVLAPLFRRAEAAAENRENLARGWCMTEDARLAAVARVRDGQRAEAKLRSVERELELRDYAGALVPADSIHVTELSFARRDVITVFVQLRESHAPVPAVEPPTVRLSLDTQPLPSQVEPQRHTSLCKELTMKCQQCGVREAEVRLIDVTDTHAGQRQLCAICASGELRTYEEEIADEAHARLPDGPTLDDILERAERHGTPDQRRQLALMLRARAAQESGRLTPTANAFLARYAPPSTGGGGSGR